MALPVVFQLEDFGVRTVKRGRWLVSDRVREIAGSIQRSPKTEKLHVANGTALLIEIGSARRKIEAN